MNIYLFVGMFKAIKSLHIFLKIVSGMSWNKKTQIQNSRCYNNAAHVKLNWQNIKNLTQLKQIKYVQKTSKFNNVGQ